jgi:thiamine pyrophosphate-dependent acetolactate synthase large subunit-like protein
VRQPSVVCGSSSPMVSSSSPPCSHGPGLASSETAAASISRPAPPRPSAAMDHLVRWSRRVRSADEAAEAVTDAFGSFTGRKRPVHVEIPVDVLGDAASTAAALRAALLAGLEAGAWSRAAALRSACLQEAMADAGPYAEINASVRAALPADGVLTGDSSQVTYFGSVHFFDMPAPRRFCYSPGFATLGYGLPAGLGAAIGLPGTPVAVLLGDGALMFSVQELITLVEQRLPVPVIVVDNGGYQEIKDQEAARGIPPIGVELRTPDLAALAVAMGARGVRTTSTAVLTELVAGALGSDGPTLIHFDIR